MKQAFGRKTPGCRQAEGGVWRQDIECSGSGDFLAGWTTDRVFGSCLVKGLFATRSLDRGTAGR